MIDLSQEKYIVLDIETKDSDLLKLGPGVRRGGEILGIGVRGGTSKRQCYISWNHVEGNSHSVEAAKQWAIKELTRPNQMKLGANILYDLDFLTHWGVPVSGPFYDIQIAEPLIDENQRGFSLNRQAIKYLNEEKRDGELKDFCKQRGWRGHPQEHFKKMSAKLIEPYVIGDLELPDRIFDKQIPILKEKGLWDLFIMETKLIPILLAMRQRGVRIDTKKANTMRTNFESQIKMSLDELSEIAGFEVNVNSNDSMKKVMDKLGITYGLTKTGKASVTKDFLSASSHPFLKKVSTTKKLKTISNLVLNGIMGTYNQNGRIHACFNQLRSDESGTVSGRFSGSNPNLQQIPARDPFLGPMCRSLFIPEEGEDWARLDYSQIELRILAHYARGKGAQEIRNAYTNDSSMDFHQWCANLANIERDPAKSINFGLVYGMGINKLGATLGLTKDQAKSFLASYHKAMPFLKQTVNACMNACEKQGFVRTTLNRRRNFPLWEPRDWNLSRSICAIDNKNEMIQKVKTAIDLCKQGNEKTPCSGIQRSMKHKSLNAVIQGTAADQMKKAMVDIWESGVCNILGAPLITVHDELDWSIPRSKEGKEAIKEVKHLMEVAIPFKVPVIAELIIGKHWGECK